MAFLAELGDWKYTPDARTKAHWVRSGRWHALCGIEADWRGTGSQTEYERAAQLKKCGNCDKRGAPK